MDNIIGVIQEFWKAIPVVGLDAFYVFLAVGLLKMVGVLKEDLQAQLGNIAASWFLSGQLPDINFAMTAVVAGVYYHVWKFIKPYLEKAWTFLSGKLSSALKQ